jgi:hypothetical protein
MTRRTAVRIGLATLSVVVGPSRQAWSVAPAVEIGPDRSVGDLRTIQIEPYIAAHPSKPGSLIVSGAEAIPGKSGVHAAGLTQGALEATAYASADGGRTWLATELNASGDPPVSVNNRVTYGGDGTAYYSTNESPAAGGSYIGVYRSTDEGLSWGGHVRAPGVGYDQPRIVAGTGSNSTTVYIAAAYGGIGVLRSVDAGGSFELVSRISPNNLGNQPREPLILADNSLLIPYADFPTRVGEALTASRIYVIRSENGGASFDTPHFVADMPRSSPGGGVGFATDLSDGKFRGRIYVVWESGDFGARIISFPPNFRREESGTHREISIAYSTDNGKSWSAPKQLAQPSSGPAFMGCLAVAPNGTLGALWIQHEKYETNPRDYRAWFAASTDGGETFTAPHAVSSAVSSPNRPELEKIDYLKTRYRGGDYIGLTAASDSVFHAVWADARDGLFRIFHAPIRVAPG